jgi:ribonucleotide monophosphatase NagD (HAD superfamily)
MQAAPDPEPAPVTMRDLLARYDGLLVDAYGVLVDARGALPGAAELLAELARTHKPFAIVTNDASRAQATYRARFAGYGIDVAGERFVTSGSLLPGYFARHGLSGARCCVLGTADSVAYVVAGGGVPVALAPGMAIDALVVCDDDGFDFLPAIEIALSAIVRALDAGRMPALVLPNPDLVYPKSSDELGLTAGTIALVIEAALAQRFPLIAPRFDRLGKPAPHLFVHASEMLGIARERLVMIGDQIDTDVAGANAAGVPVALVEGVSRWRHARRGSATPVPTYLLDRILP